MIIILFSLSVFTFQGLSKIVQKRKQRPEQNNQQQSLQQNDHHVNLSTRKNHQLTNLVKPKLFLYPQQNQIDY